MGLEPKDVYSGNIYLFKNYNKKLEKVWNQWHRSDVFIAVVEHISLFLVVFLLLTLTLHLLTG